MFFSVLYFNNMANLVFVLGVLIGLQVVYAQENIQTVVAKSLEECYNNSEIVDKDNKLPMTLSVLLDLIRKIENGPDRIDLSALAVNLLHRYVIFQSMKSTDFFLNFNLLVLATRLSTRKTV